MRTVATRKTAVAKNGEAVSKAHSTAIFEKGAYTSAELARGLTALLGDIAAGRVGPQQANALCNASGKLLKLKQLELQYGQEFAGTARKILQISEPEK